MFSLKSITLSAERYLGYHEVLASDAQHAMASVGLSTVCAGTTDVWTAYPLIS